MNTITLKQLREELKAGEKPKEMVCLGCAAKVELVQTIYPVLEKLSAWLKKNTEIRLQPREDVYIASTNGSYQVHRAKFRISDIEKDSCSLVTEEFAKYKPDGIVLLSNFTPFPDQERLLTIFKNFYKAASKGHKQFTVGKGHTIQIAKSPEEEYLIIDFFTISGGNEKFLVANNDTISNIDPNLRHTSWVTIFISLHNALNDLFLCGVNKDISIFPTVDVRDLNHKEELLRSLELYHTTYPKFRLINEDILGFNTKSIGATVTGLTEKELPRNNNLQGGEVLIATRPIGDLAPLTEFLIKQLLNEDTSKINELRKKVLQTMLTPNIELSHVIEEFLPAKGESFDQSRHIMSTRDMSGPGLIALEELAQDSSKDIYLKNIVLHDEMVADVDMPNPTSGTNGAIIIACYTEVAKKIMGRIRDIGLEPWEIGEVRNMEGDKPKIIIDSSLAKYPFIKGMKKNIFQNFEYR